MQTLDKFYQIEVAWQPKYLILYTAPCLSCGLFLPLALVSSRRKVVIRLSLVWKNFVFNEEMSCFGCENKNGGHFTRFKSKNYSWN